LLGVGFFGGLLKSYILTRHSWKVYGRMWSSFIFVLFHRA